MHYNSEEIGALKLYSYWEAEGADRKLSVGLIWDVNTCFKMESYHAFFRNDERAGLIFKVNLDYNANISKKDLHFFPVYFNQNHCLTLMTLRQK